MRFRLILPLFLILIATSLSAADEPNGLISGRVTDQLGAPLSGIKVSAGDETTLSGPDGSYTLSVPPGAYYSVKACDCELNRFFEKIYPDAWFPEWNIGLAGAKDVAVTSGKVTGGIDFRMEPGSHFLLTVRGPDGTPVNANGPAAGCYGRLWMLAQNGAPADTSFGSFDCRSADRNDGTYALPAVPPGRGYVIEAHPEGAPFLPRFSGNVSRLTDAQPIFIAEGASPAVIPVTLTMSQQGATLSGRVRSVVAGIAPQDLTVILARVDVPGVNNPLSTSVSADGSYSFRGVEPGLYFVGVPPPVGASGSATYHAGPELDRSVIEVGSTDIPNLDMLFESQPESAPVSVFGPVFATVRSGSAAPVDPLQISTALNASDIRVATTAPWLFFTHPLRTGNFVTVDMRVNAADLAPGVYFATVTVSSATGGLATQMPVCLTVSPVPVGHPWIRSSERIIAKRALNYDDLDEIELPLINEGDAPGEFSLSGVLAYGVYPRTGVINSGGRFGALLATVGPNVGTIRSEVEIRTSGELSDTVLLDVTGAPHAAKVAHEPLEDGENGVVIPGVVGGVAGRNGSLWSTDIHAVNPVFDETSTMLFSDATGTSMMEVPAYVTFRDVVRSAFERDTAYGAIEIRGKDAAFAWARHWTWAPDGKGTYGQAVPALTGELLGSFLEGSVHVPVILGGAFRTNLLLTETAGGDATAIVKLRSAGGALLGGSRQIHLGPYGSFALNDVLAGTGVDLATAEVSVSGSGKVGAIASLIDEVTNDPTTVAGRRDAALTIDGKIIVPVVAHTDGVAGSHWRSDVWAANTGRAPVKFVVVLRRGGTEIITGSAHTVPEGGVVALPDVVGGELHAQGRGSLEFEMIEGSAKDLFVASRTWTSGGGGTFGQGIEPVTTELLPAGFAQVWGLDSGKLFRSNILLVETSGMPATVFDSTGNQIELGPYESRAISTFGFQGGYDAGQIFFRDWDSAGHVAIVPSTIDMQTNDPMTIPVFYQNP